MQGVICNVEIGRMTGSNLIELLYRGSYYPLWAWIGVLPWDLWPLGIPNPGSASVSPDSRCLFRCISQDHILQHITSALEVLVACTAEAAAVSRENGLGYPTLASGGPFNCGLSSTLRLTPAWSMPSAKLGMCNQSHGKVADGFRGHRVVQRIDYTYDARHGAH